MLVQRKQPLVEYPGVSEKLPGATRVLAADDVGRFESAHCRAGKGPQIADRCGDEHKPTMDLRPGAGFARVHLPVLMCQFSCASSHSGRGSYE